MHKGVICLTQATDRDQAVSNVESFLEQYGDGHVWDWYVIGGRWSGTLNTKTKEFFEKSNAHFKKNYPKYNNLLTQNMVNDEADALQKIWEELGQTTKNPFARDGYETNTENDDAVPLTDCIDIIKEWTFDVNLKADEYWAKMLAEYINEKDSQNGGTMSAYYAGLYRDLKYDNFSFESNVYDIVNYTNNPEEALKEPENWFAVMVDLHN